MDSGNLSQNNIVYRFLIHSGYFQQQSLDRESITSVCHIGADGGELCPKLLHITGIFSPIDFFLLVPSARVQFEFSLM